MNNFVDYESNKQMDDFNDETILIAEKYSDAREECATAKLKLDNLLADAYASNPPKIRESLALDKAYIQLTINDPTAKTIYETYINEEAKYKGIERILTAREAKKSWKQSVLSYQKMLNGK